jgi:hypothetical protein
MGVAAGVGVGAMGVPAGVGVVTGDGVDSAAVMTSSGGLPDASRESKYIPSFESGISARE